MDPVQSVILDRKNGATELWTAMHTGFEETPASRLAKVERLLIAGHNPNEEWDHEKWDKERHYPGGCVLPSWSVEEHGNRTSPLNSAVVSGNIDLVGLLLQFGADTQSHTRTGLTPLHLAVLANDIDTINLLCDSGADIEARIQDNKYPRTIEGFTPLQLAVASSQLDATRVLLHRGVDVIVEIKTGWTACEMAVLGRHAQVLNTFFDHQLSKAEEASSPFFARRKQSTQDPIVSQHLQFDRNDAGSRKAAQNLIRKGLEAEDTRCKRLLDNCILEAFISVRSHWHTYPSAERGMLVLQKVEKLLLETAGISEFISWPQKFCMQCQRFQLEASQTEPKEFEHSPDLATLKNTASHKCPLCEILVAVLKPSSKGSSYARDPDKRDSAIRLRLTLGSEGGGTINVAGSGVHGQVNLKRVDDYMNTVICTTDPSEQGGNSFWRGLMLSKACLEICHSKHTCQSQDLPQLPTRVVDVGDEQTPPSLYCSDGRHERYAALSYCWGETGHYKTTKQNLNMHVSGILFDNLPKTIQDAIIITRALDLRYLWIDAICIIQDSHEDFVSEVARMGDIYARATLTIAAKDSKSCSEGCLPKLSHPCSTILPLNISTNTNFRRPSSILFYGYQPWPLASQVMAVPKLYSWLSDKASVLETRGWTFQEDILSSRVLSCRDEAIVWSCLENVCYEGDFDAHVFKQKEATILKTAVVKQVGKQGCTLKDQELLKYWFQTVAEYSTRFLSHRDDKLRAIAALQHRFGNLLHDIPVMGMWRSQHFLRSLLWTCSPDSAQEAQSQDGDAPHSQQIGFCLPRCPSWSWASISNPVTYSAFGIPDADTDLEPKLVSWDLSVVEADVDARGSVTLYSELFHVDKVTSYHNQRKDLLRFDVYLAAFMAWSKGGEAKVLVTGDLGTERIMTARGPNPTVSMLLIRDTDFTVALKDFWFILIYTIPFTPPPQYGYPVSPEGTRPRAVVMCLRKISENELHFRRIGLAMVYEPEEWRHCGTKEEVKIF